jgi:hypothetical protein
MLCDRTLERRVFDHKTSQAIGSASLSFNFRQAFTLSHTFGQVMIHFLVNLWVKAHNLCRV